MASNRLFKPSFVRKLTHKSVQTSPIAASHLSGTTIGAENSFRFDPPGSGLKSTQQLPVDWSQFENHTFFNSAEAKTNTAFDVIINGYPFDGTKDELETFFDELTGFEKHVYDRFPKNVGFLHFSGTVVDETPAFGYDENLGSHISVIDHAGALFPSLSKINTGESVLDPMANKSISFEMHLLVPDQGTDTETQILVQKIDGSDIPVADGLTIALMPSLAASTTVEVKMLAASGSNSIETDMEIPKGEFVHICGTLDRSSGEHNLKLFQNAELASTSNSLQMGKLSPEFVTAPLTIGTGSIHDTITPLQTLSGSIDEFRAWHSVRSTGQLKKYLDRTVFSNFSGDLKTYFKFNEPSGDFVSNDVVLDSSGNSLHARITNYHIDNRDPTKIIDTNGDVVQTPLVLESSVYSPNLFPSHSDVITLNKELLASAINYDSNNPNLITKLVPKHYLLESQLAEGFDTEFGDVGDDYSYSGTDAVPGYGKLGSAQLLASLLFTWARFFDETKMFLDHISNLLHVDYTGTDVVADQFLPMLAEHHGIELPSPFEGASIEQLFEGLNLGPDLSISEHTLQYVQNQLWRRILTNVNEIIRSKGTVHSLKVLMRSMGVNPDKYFRFREYGGSKTKDLSDIRKAVSEVTAMTDFSGSIAPNTSMPVDTQGIPLNQPFFMSPFLSGSRTEVGYPPPAGAFIDASTGPDGGPYGLHGISTDPNDGLFTSGSWSYEAIYKFDPIKTPSLQPQSLVRLHATGSDEIVPAVITNLVADPDAKTLDLYSRPGLDPADDYLQLTISDIDIFDGNIWHICFGRSRNDSINSYVSSSYYLSAARQNYGDIIEHKTTSSLFKETIDPSRDNRWSVIDPALNASGSCIVIGNQQIDDTVASAYWGLNPIADDASRTTQFAGQVAQIRFWSKALSTVDITEHIRNYASLGVEDPLTNFNFTITPTGSFEKLRLDVSTHQAHHTTDNIGNLDIFDYSQSGFHILATGFEPETRIIKPERIYKGMLDPKFDEHSVTNKVRIRSFLNFDNVTEFGAEVAPVYEILPSERPQDDTRFAIDMSSVQALNEDIIKIFSTLDSLDNILGAPELLFATEYPDLKNLREVYFNRLTDKINITSFFEFFKWFDNSIGLIIEDLIPKKTKFLGMNFIIESHMLERAKFKYSYEDVYLGENNRHGLKGTITLQQYIAKMGRY